MNTQVCCGFFLRSSKSFLSSTTHVTFVACISILSFYMMKVCCVLIHGLMTQICVRELDHSLLVFRYIFAHSSLLWTLQAFSLYPTPVQSHRITILWPVLSLPWKVTQQGYTVCPPGDRLKTLIKVFWLLFAVIYCVVETAPLHLIRCVEYYPVFCHFI